MPRLALTQVQRLEIVRERQRGVAAAALAQRFGVSRQTIHLVVRQLRGAPNADGGPTRSFTVRASEEDLRRFDGAIGRHGLTRAEAIRRLMLAVGNVFVADEEEADRLRQLGVALNKVGTNVNQIARACNEARHMGQPIPYTAQSHAELREVTGLAFAVADQVRHLADGKRASVQEAITAAFGGGPHEEP